MEQQLKLRTTELLALNEQLRREIEERRDAEDLLRRYERIFSVVRDPMAYVDKNYTYQLVNDAYARFHRRPADEIRGRSMAELLGTEVFEKQVRPRLDHVLLGHEFHLQEWFDFPVGRRFMDVSYYPLLESDRSVSGVVASLRDMTDIKHTQESLIKRSHDIGERIKEMDCLYGIFKILEKQYLSWDEVFQEIVDMIPSAWQCLETTCARLIIDGQEFRTDHFRETVWKQQRDVWVYGKPVGLLEICYLKGGTESDEPPFLKEERALISAIADHLGKDIEHKRLHENLDRMNHQLMRAHRQRKSLSKKIIGLLEKDRQNVAMELHDQVGQTLTSLKMSLEMVRHQLKDGDSDLKDRINAAKLKASQAIKDLKNISHGLRPAMLDTLGLESSLRELFNEIEGESGIKIQFFSRDIPRHFCKEKEIALYRIAQEALNNAIKHAQAGKIFVNLVKKNRSLLLGVEDDGVGFEPDRIMEDRKGKRLGLVFMRERVIQLDGEFTIESREQGGTHLLVEIPA